MKNPLDNSRPLRLFYKDGTWTLEFESLEQVSAVVFRPVVYSVEGPDPILGALERMRVDGQLIAEAQELFQQLSEETETELNLEPQDQKWIQSTKEQFGLTRRGESEMTSGERIARRRKVLKRGLDQMRSMNGGAARIEMLERRIAGLESQLKELARNASVGPKISFGGADDGASGAGVHSAMTHEVKPEDAGAEGQRPVPSESGQQPKDQRDAPIPFQQSDGESAGETDSSSDSAPEPKPGEEGASRDGMEASEGRDGGDGEPSAERESKEQVSGAGEKDPDTPEVEEGGGESGEREGEIPEVKDAEAEPSEEEPAVPEVKDDEAGSDEEEPEVPEVKDDEAGSGEEEPEAAEEPKGPFIPVLPTLSGFEGILRMLVGDDISLSTAPSEKVPSFSDDPSRFYLSPLIDDDDEIIGAMIADLPALVRLGGGLLMMPEEVIKEQIDAGEPETDVIEAMSEVFNTSSSLINEISGNAHVRVTDVEPMNIEENTWLEDPSLRVDMEHERGGIVTIVSR